MEITIKKEDWDELIFDAAIEVINTAETIEEAEKLFDITALYAARIEERLFKESEDE